jgi:hypothetical protein
MSHDAFDRLPEEERPRRARERRTPLGLGGRGRWLALGIVVALVVAVIVGMLFTQTDRGRSQVLAFTLGALGGRLSGDLEIDYIEGNLFTGARAYGLRLTDLEGAPLAIVDSAYIRYRVATFVGGDIVINRVVLYGASIDLFQMPGDTLWNYQRVLMDPSPGAQEGRPGATLIESLELHDSDIRIRSAFEPDSRLSAERQQLEIEEALADTARWMIESVPGGYLRTMLVNARHLDVAELFISPDERGGIYLEVEDAIADVRMWRDPPLEVRELQARLHLREGIINFEAPEFALPSTRGEGVGRIDLSGERPMYDLVLTLPAFNLSDIRWLYPWLPSDPVAAGRGSARVWLEDRPEELLVFARDLILELPGTRLTGEFGILTGDTPRFVGVDLEAEPLDVESVERLLPEGLPVEGLEIGGAVIRGAG